MLKYTKEELELALTEVSDNADPVYAFVGAMVGGIPAIVLYLFFSQMGGIFFIMLILPPFMIGYAAKFMGRTYTIKHRIPVGLTAAFIHVLGSYLAQFDFLIFILTPVTFAIAFTIAKVKLNSVQSWAIAEADFGKLNIDS